MKPTEYTFTPTLEEFLRDGKVPNPEQSASAISRLCEMAMYDPDSTVKKVALMSLRKCLPFSPVLELYDGQLFLSAPDNRFGIFIENEKAILANYFQK
jgi:hypothetical protein